MSFVGIEFERLKSQYTYIYCRKSRMIYAEINLDSLINVIIGVLGYIPSLNQA